MTDYTEHLISMAGGDGEPDLDQIQARARTARDYPGMVTIEESQADVPALLAVVRSQQAKIERVEAVVDRGLEDMPAWYGGYILADDLRAALTATEGA